MNTFKIPKFNKIQEIFLILILFFILTLIYLFPILQGLILLPLDMLVSNYSPWYIPGQILVKNPYMQDSIIQLFPWKHLVFQSFLQGIIPFWNPYQFMGMPFMASMKPMVFYPFNIFHIFGEINSWHILLYSQLLLSLLFMYLLSRSFKLHVLPSIFTSLAFALNTLMVGVLEFGSEGHVLLWLPIFILCAKKYLEEQKGKYLLLLGISIGLSIFAGQLQYTGYSLIFLITFTIYYGYTIKSRIHTYYFLFLSIILGIGFSAIQLLPSIELFSHSLRGIVSSHDIFLNGLDKPYQLLRLFSPDFFGNPTTNDLKIGYIESIGYFGIIPLFFSVYAMLFLRKNNFVKFFTLTSIVAALLSIQGIGQILYILHIPLITSGEGDRIFSLVYPSMAILSGFGLTEFLIKKQKRNIISSCAFLALFSLIIIVCALILHHSSADAMKAFIHNIQFDAIILALFSIGAIIYILLQEKTSFARLLFLIFIISLTYSDLFRMGYRFLTFSNEKFLYPQMSVIKYVQDASKYSLARNIGLTEPELSTYLNVYSVETYNPLYLLRNAILLQALQGRLYQQLPNNKYFITKEESLKYALDFLGVSMVVIDKDSNPSSWFFNTIKFQNNFDLLYKDPRYAIYKNTTAYPRFNVYYQTKVVKNDKEALNLISQNSFDFRKKIILEENPPIVLTEGTGSAQLISSNVNAQQFKVKTNVPALFYISDTYFPGWRAQVNNRDTKIYRTNYNLRSIIVPAGTSIVTFSYIPSTFYLGMWLSISSIFTLLMLAVFHKRLYRYT